MSLRGYRVYRHTESDGFLNVLIESTQIENFLIIKNNALLEIDNNVGENLKNVYSKVADGYGIIGILKLFEGDSYLLLITGVISVGQLYNCDIHKITNVQFIALHCETSLVFDSRIAELQRFLSSGIFYYASLNNQKPLFNLTLSAQERRKGCESEYRFFWNRNLCFPFEHFNINLKDWLVKCMCGSVLIRTIYVGHRTAKVAIISRLSCERVGTRFNVRGVNSDGNVANFVETEQLLTFEENEASFVQIRGSVPLFWEQPGINVGSHKVKLKSLELSLPAFQRHYLQLQNFYGNVTTVNLLGLKEGERLLYNAFQTAINSTKCLNLPFISFDHHAEMKQSKNSVNTLLQKLDSTITETEFFCQKNNTVIKYQKGVIRTNCLDCLDRTNSVQLLIGVKVLKMQIALLEIEKAKANISNRFEEIIKDLWIKNGDQCSVIYAGTGALDGKSKLKDASRSIARTIQNNLMDSSKQESFDLLLLGCTYGNKNFDKLSNLLPAQVVRECPNEALGLVERIKEMCDVKELLIFVGTWNVNGGKNMYNVAFRHEKSLDTWIFPTELFESKDLNYDIIAIGLEEIVDLNASNMMKASTTNQRVWCEGIKKTINEFLLRENLNETSKKGNFVVLACEQLVGICLIIFVRSYLMNCVSDLATNEVKAGMGGATGNKGSVVVRLTINSTSICFVCSHFAAGQNEVINRNEDYNTTLRKIRFPLGRTIYSHDVIFWLGDFNYRISLNGDEVKNAIKLLDFEHLIHYDQLTQQKLLGKIFVNFNEGFLNFAPTYKYDTFSNDYDTSEKCRAPAWTDRVLWYDLDQIVHLIHYGRSELKTSDHRPVSAIFKVDSMKIVDEKCEEVISDVIHSMGPPDATILCMLDNKNFFTQDLVDSVLKKLKEFSLNVVLTRMKSNMLEIILKNGIEALASLSLDQIVINNCKLNVFLKSPNWAEFQTKRIFELFETNRYNKETNSLINDCTTISCWSEANINFQDDDEDYEITE